MSRKNEITTLKEARRILKINTETEMERITKQLLKLQIKEFVAGHQQAFEQEAHVLPSGIRLSYCDEFNDEGGTEPYIDDIYFYDENGKMIDIDLEIFVNVSYRKEPILSTFQEKIRDLLYEEFATEDLEKYIGEQMIIF